MICGVLLLLLIRYDVHLAHEAAGVLAGGPWSRLIRCGALLLLVLL